VDAADRPRVGKLANAVKQEVEQAFVARQTDLGESGSGNTGKREDLSLPGRTIPLGKLHPVTQIMEEVCGIFEGLGFALKFSLVQREFGDYLN